MIKRLNECQPRKKQQLITSCSSSVVEQIQTFVHRAKNKEIRRWASAKETDESDCAPFMGSLSEVPGSEN